MLATTAVHAALGALAVQAVQATPAAFAVHVVHAALGALAHAAPGVLCACGVAARQGEGAGAARGAALAPPRAWVGLGLRLGLESGLGVRG